ncbi:hypothetical protein IMZ11_01735 [Microtetraspora sp. AC03309]|uniref:hypothetical protein n=1 Tax=Microtetraspora sp. AC03309 TaxID=2779376 RepID=UPI001E3C2406|nr:hypothetical protein [Microtetraspora sp. AC03309]MCC5574360.1 hypothetical protein [Microtetraspora sp. AC03309]
MRTRMTAGLLAATVGAVALIPAASAFAATAGPGATSTAKPTATAAAQPTPTTGAYGGSGKGQEAGKGKAGKGGDGHGANDRRDRRDPTSVTVRGVINGAGGGAGSGTGGGAGTASGSANPGGTASQGKPVGYGKSVRRTTADQDKGSRNRQVTLSGYLTSKGAGLSGQKISLSFKPSGRSTYTYVTSATTGAKGYYSVKVPGGTGGTWKADFSGTGTKTKSSGTAYVR